MYFIDGSADGVDVNPFHILRLELSETEANFHAIGDAGLAGSSIPENIY